MLSRRDFFHSTLALYAAWPRQLFAGAVQQNPRFAASPFTLGVASGDPSPTGVVLWTHIRPEAVRINEPLWLQVSLDARFDKPLLPVQRQHLRQRSSLGFALPLASIAMRTARRLRRSVTGS